MAVNMETALKLVKIRLNRLPDDTTLDEYLSARVSAAEGYLNRMMSVPLNDSTADLMLLVDLTVWQYQNRDQASAQPQWLRQRLRERFVYRGNAL